MRDMRILNRRKNGMVDHGEQGMVTSEIAMGLMVLSLVIILMLGVIRAGIEYGNVQEQSREIAVQLARGKVLHKHAVEYPRMFTSNMRITEHS